MGIEEQESSVLECSLCNAEFDIENVGGIEGQFGFIPGAFCAYCLAAITDMVKQECPTCMKETE